MRSLEPRGIVEPIALGEHQSTGPLPVGFSFERDGTGYDHFDVSTEGVMTFSRGDRHTQPRGRVRLTERIRLGSGRVSYEVLGVAPRRRLRVWLVDHGPPGATLKVTVHERTGIVEIDPGRQSLGEPTIRQPDIVHSSPSRTNSARKIG